jgi:hypothetical protein
MSGGRSRLKAADEDSDASSPLLSDPSSGLAHTHHSMSDPTDDKIIAAIKARHDLVSPSGSSATPRTATPEPGTLDGPFTPLSLGCAAPSVVCEDPDRARNVDDC